MRGTSLVFKEWRWLAVLLWMVIIFTASSDAGSSGHTSRIIGPIVRWLIPDISDKALARVVFSVRKTAHVTEYAILASLLWWAVRKSAERRRVEVSERATSGSGATPFRAGGPVTWRWTHALLALGVSAAYAASDEIHQYFVPTREARLGDVLLDTAGAALGLLAVWIIGRWRRCW